MEASAGPSGRRLRVLIADDNCDAADTTAVLLSCWGYQAEVAYDGKSAFHTACDFHPDVMLLDIAMPGLDGYHLAEEIRHSDELASETTLIAMTAYGADEDRQRSHEAGFDYHLVKPVEPALLERALNLLAHGRELRDRLWEAGHRNEALRHETGMLRALLMKYGQAQ